VLLVLLLLLQALLRIDTELAILPDMTANTPLHWACETGNVQLVQQLLALKPGINMQNLNQNEYSAGGGGGPAKRRLQGHCIIEIVCYCRACRSMMLSRFVGVGRLAIAPMGSVSCARRGRCHCDHTTA
jgi:hypothetical protein